MTGGGIITPNELHIIIVAKVWNREEVVDGSILVAISRPTVSEDWVNRQYGYDRDELNQSWSFGCNLLGPSILYSYVLGE